MRAVEFYSGIGGWHHAIKELSQPIEVVGAFEINTAANLVYRHNFPLTPIYQRNIEALKVSDLSLLAADIWFLSPPCQPYTRLGYKKDLNDSRSKSFAHLLELLDKLTNQPRWIFLENVVGFESSIGRDLLVKTLSRHNYFLEEYHLNPIDFGVPNSRLRYYLVAKKSDGISIDPPTNMIRTNLNGEDRGAPLTLCLSEFLETNLSLERRYHLSDAVLLRYSRILDIVKPSARRSCCFTKAYSHYLEGTGSVLQTNSELNTIEVFERLSNCTTEADQLALLRSLDLRFFTPLEVARISGFKEKTFSFPSGIGEKSAYKLLGNSLNIVVIKELLAKYLETTN